MNQQIHEDIDKIIEQLRKTIIPIEIFIFGSVASGNERFDSDIDICIITKITNVRKIDIIRKIRRDILEVINRPVDILIYDEFEFETRSKLPSTFEYKIKQEGVKVA